MLNDRKEKTLKRVTTTIDTEDYTVIDSIETTRFQLLCTSAARGGRFWSGITTVMRSIFLENAVGQAKVAQ